MYLYQISIYNYVTTVAEKAAKKYGIEISMDKIASNINSTVKLQNKLGLVSFLSEFPGNCSSLVSHGIQNLFEGWAVFQKAGYKSSFDDMILLSKEICEIMLYSSLIVSGTHTGMRDYLIKEFGFRVLIEDVLNPHSGNKNFFLIRDISPEVEVKEISS